MANKNSSLFSDLASSVDRKSRQKKQGIPKVTKNIYLEERTNGISDLASGNIEEKTLHWVDPAVCKMWEQHNRRYDLLSEERCKDLIEGIKAQGRQEFPAIVRKIEDPDYQYEVICGARRHWTISHLRKENYNNFKFLVDVRDLNDEEAFRLSDIENRDRQDISDYERAVDYANAAKLYYKNQKQMAQRLEVSASWLSRYLDLAKLPRDLVDLFSDIAFITTVNGRKLKPFLKDPKKRKGLQERIEKVKTRIEENGGAVYETDKNIFSYLIQSESNFTPEVKSFSIADGGPDIMKVSTRKDGGVSISINPVEKKNHQALKKLILSALDEVF